jgi:hypothetical protein
VPAPAHGLVTDERGELAVRGLPNGEFRYKATLASGVVLDGVVTVPPSATIDGNSAAFIRRQNAKTGLSDAEFKAMFAKVESFVALDTTRNDFIFHTKLYEWLNRGRGVELESLNAQVYDQLFKTPNTDKWLGLYSNDVYTALDGNGIIK